MKIKSIGIKGFRGYSRPIKVDFPNLLVLVGKNDVGKSSVLEALDIFFNDGKGCVKLDKDDINRANLESGDDCIEISVEFDDLPATIIIDTTNQTSLEAEHLLTSQKTLHIIKRYPGAGKEKVYILANHPTAKGCGTLLEKKIGELKKILDDQILECPDKTKSAELRKAIWAGQDDLCLKETEIEVAKIDAKNIWEQLKAYMPLYSLFQADRKNSDGDDEVQDPMRLAVKQVLSDPSIQADLGKVAAIVKGRLEIVAAQTLQKLNELNPNIAASLNPQIPESSALKWVDVFKSVSIAGDDQVPINKRGSGVKRLILISFFRAEAERRQREIHLPSIVYAIEEPETSQHPDHQRALVSAIISLSQASHTQILLTTHSPEIVKQLSFDNILLVADPSVGDIRRVKATELPYPSLNEVNFAAFDESTYEYHNELYGFIESQNLLDSYKDGKPTLAYNKLTRTGSLLPLQLVITEYIRHQIHHPENKNNRRFTDAELRHSIEEMRLFIRSELKP